jgi:hypothetical protein
MRISSVAKLPETYKSEAPINTAGFFLDFSGVVQMPGGSAHRWANYEHEIMARLEGDCLHVTVAKTKQFVRAEALIRLLRLFYEEIPYYLILRQGKNDMKVIHAMTFPIKPLEALEE